MSSTDHIRFIFDIIPEKIPVTGIFLYQKIILHICRLTFPIQGIICLILSLRLTLQNKQRIQFFYSNTAEDSLNKVVILNVTLLIIMTTGIIISLMGKEHFTESPYKLVIPSFIFSVMYLIVGWLGYKQRAVPTELNEQKIATTEVEKTPYQLEPIRKRMEKLFETDKIYLNKDLTIWEVSRALGTNRTYISIIINHSYHRNFSSYVNSYRIEYAKKLLQKNPKTPNQDLADLSGFGSVLSMQRAFKTAENKTLKEYRLFLNDNMSANYKK